MFGFRAGCQDKLPLPVQRSVRLPPPDQGLASPKARAARPAQGVGTE